MRDEPLWAPSSLEMSCKAKWILSQWNQPMNESIKWVQKSSHSFQGEGVPKNDSLIIEKPSLHTAAELLPPWCFPLRQPVKSVIPKFHVPWGPHCSLQINNFVRFLKNTGERLWSLWLKIPSLCRPGLWGTVGFPEEGSNQRMRMLWPKDLASRRVSWAQALNHY